MKTYWIYSFADFGGIEPIELTEEEFEELKSEEYAIFETREEAEEFAKGGEE